MKLRLKIYIFAFFAFIAVSSVLWHMSLNEKIDTAFFTNNTNWHIRQQEIKSNLLKVPILLYHNIDGKGPFSISSEKLKQQFDYLKRNDIEVISLETLFERLENPKPFKKKVVVITFDDGYKSMYEKLLPIVKKYNYPVTLFVYVDFLSDRSKNALLWNEAKQLDDNGIDIQSHTISHPDLTNISNVSEEEKKRILFHELYMSKRIISKKISKNIDIFAFPYGRFNKDLILFAEYSGYKKAVSTEYGSNIITYNNYTLHRHHIKSNYSLQKIKSIIYSY